VPEVPLVPDVPLVPEVPLVPLVPEVPEVPDVPDVPEVPEVPDVPEVPEVPDVPSELCKRVRLIFPVTLNGSGSAGDPGLVPSGIVCSILIFISSFGSSLTTAEKAKSDEGVVLFGEFSVKSALVLPYVISSP
jgi:hypothetical protein